MAGHSMDDAERFHPATLDEWRAWLAEHHARGHGVWVVSWRHGSGHDPLDYEGTVLEALCIGWIDSQVKTIDDDRSMMWFAPRRPQSTWVRNNKRRVARLEAEGRMQPAGQALVEAAKANGMWIVLDDAEAGVVPEDLSKRIEATPGGRDAWDALTAGRRKRALMDLALAKTAATRSRRIDAVAAELTPQ